MKKLDLHNPIGTESRLYSKELLITQDIQRVLEQASVPGHLGVARVRPRGSGRWAFTRSLFVYSASRGERERACKDAAGPGGYIKLWVRARSASFWRPWIEDGGEKEQEAPHHAVEAMPDGPGITDASGKLSQYRHPVRLFWPKSKCYDYLYQEAEALLKNFPIQATISFYEDSDSEDETEELICEN
ncbi:protein ripply2 [Cervus elaphus]|uniref:protein ripply2 n=1 Tax=Cervus canadensis TaxID=1574408 RepID=UPI001CA380E4|nr:protein ripply2 [Cervus canadensis]XP_043743901.1 protein ripply2 [Cervus elaphus]